MPKYLGACDEIDYTPGSAVAAGAIVVVGGIVGIALSAIPANTLSSLRTSGVVEVPKASGSSTAITAGATVYWDATNSRATTTASGNTLMGKTIAATVDADTLVKVRLSQA